MVAPIPRQELIDEVCRLANELGRVPKVRDLRERGQYSVSGFYNEFNGWNDALEAAGLLPNRGYDVSRDALLDAITELAEELGSPPTREDMMRQGRFSANPFYREFDSWNDALEAAGYDIHTHHGASAEDLLGEIDRLAVNGKPPTRITLEQRGKYSAQAYYSRFGSWSNAVEEAGFELRYLRRGNRREYDYGDGWDEKKREEVRERDGYECQHSGCEITGQEHKDRFGERLTVHHLVPANEFDTPRFRNDVRNLVTLCRLHHRTWEAADDYCPLDQSLPEGCDPAVVDPYLDLKE